jgi:hypothetical protein
MARNGRTYQVTLGTTATLIASYSKDRIAFKIRNDSGVTVYIGYDPTMSTASGDSLATGTARTWYYALGDALNRPFYGMVANNTAKISVDETIDEAKPFKA